VYGLPGSNGRRFHAKRDQCPICCRELQQGGPPPFWVGGADESNEPLRLVEDGREAADRVAEVGGEAERDDRVPT